MDPIAEKLTRSFFNEKTNNSHNNNMKKKGKNMKLELKIAMGARALTIDFHYMLNNK